MLGAMALRCVIADDNPTFLEAASDLLARQGLDVVGVATSGDEAVERVAALAPDVALLDINLGEESGFDVAWQLAGTRVILVSTDAREDYEDLIAASPAVGFVHKSQLSRRAIAEVLAGGET
jgi:two-component system, NarL family, nitrate/nitrite response regulator NarL